MMTATNKKAMTKDEAAARVAAHKGIEATCPHCGATATMTPDYIRGGEGRLDWQCSNCRSGSSASEIEQATARIANRKIIVPRRVTEL